MPIISYNFLSFSFKQRDSSSQHVNPSFKEKEETQEVEQILKLMSLFCSFSFLAFLFFLFFCLPNLFIEVPGTGLSARVAVMFQDRYGLYPHGVYSLSGEINISQAISQIYIYK